jgi:type IV pilus assembly protein PilO
MALLGLPDDPTQQKRLLIGMLPLVLLVAYWFFMHDGYTAELAEMEARLQNLETRNSQARMRAPQSRQLEERLAAFERHIDRLEELVPRGEEVSQLLNQINQRAEQVGVQVARFTPGATDIGAHYNRRTFEMTVVGTYHEIARFLSEIGSLPRIITAIDLSLAPNTSRGGDSAGQLLSASFQIETYVLPSPAQRAAANQGANSGV